MADTLTEPTAVLIDEYRKAVRGTARAEQKIAGPLEVPRAQKFEAATRAALECAIAATMHEAFMTGRIYCAMGEKESPMEIEAKLIENCAKAVLRALEPAYVR